MLTQIYDINTVRRLLRGLHKAAEQHRFVHEDIDASTRNDASRQMEQHIYLNKVEAVEKAIERLLSAQLDLHLMARGVNVCEAEGDIAELLTVERKPGCDEQPPKAA